MTVSEIIKDLLEYNMITSEAAIVLLNAEFKATMFDIEYRNTNLVFQPYHGGTGNPYYVSTTTNDPVINTK